MMDEVYLDIPAVEENIRKMREGIDQLKEVVGNINGEADDVLNHWKGAAQEAYMDQYNQLRSAMTTDVPDAVEGMIDFLEKFLNDMIELDRNAASSLRG